MEDRQGFTRNTQTSKTLVIRYQIIVHFTTFVLLMAKNTSEGTHAFKVKNVFAIVIAGKSACASCNTDFAGLMEISLRELAITNK